MLKNTLSMARSNQAELFDINFEVSSQRKASLSARSGTFMDNMKLPIHRWFRFSAGFSAGWVEQVIQELSPVSILDPFAGSGTTLLAADAARVPAYGYESHPFMARISRIKIGWDRDEKKLIEAGNQIMLDATRKSHKQPNAIPDLLKKCYTEEGLQKLFLLRDAWLCSLDTLDPDIGELIWLAITSILRSCSYVGTAQWQYVLPNKRKVKTLDPFIAFEHKIHDMGSDIKKFRSIGASSKAKILLHDARLPSLEIPEKSIDLVISSPPYPNNYDYADATRLEMTFWGEISGWGDLQDVVRQYLVRSCSQHATAEKLDMETLLTDPSVVSIHTELSDVCHELAIVRKTKGGNKAYHTMIAAYFSDISKVFQGLRRTCSTGGTVCFVIGDSAPYGVYVPVEKWLGELAIAAGFKSYSFEKLRDRNIKWKNRKHDVPLHEGRLWIRG